MKTISFTNVRSPYGWLGNMAPYPVIHEGLKYRTTEALFQCLRFIDYPDIQRLIRMQVSPVQAKSIARRHYDLIHRYDEADLERMRYCLRLKIEQHPELRTKLLETGEAIIVEDASARPSESGRFWGAIFADGWVGANWVGQLWMELRDKLRKEE